VEGFSTPDKRTNLVILEANTQYWDKGRAPKVKRIVFDNTLGQKEAVELVKSREGRIDLVTELSPLETLRVAESSLATVVKNRGNRVSVFGRFNMLRTGSPWNDARLRRAANFAINRADLIQYATNGNGVVIPALVPGIQDPSLAPYPFDPGRARELLREAGQSPTLAITMIAPQNLQAQATVIGRMLDQSGFKATVEVLDPTAYSKRTMLSHLDQPAEKQSWDIALTASYQANSSPLLDLYQWYAIDGPDDWVAERPELRRLYEQALATVDPGKQEDLLRQMERHTHEQAYLLFLYKPVLLYAVNRAVQLVPYATSWTRLADTSLTDQHWSLRKGNSKK
jgi:peptide/nickel transport system substrate-binding protein